MPPQPAGFAFRPAGDADLDACTRIWKAGIDDYASRLGQPPVNDDLGPLRRLFAHLLATDPDRFWVATDATADSRDPVGFASATVRGDLWFLAMLFVMPGRQGAGLGAALLDRALAGRAPSGPEDVPGPGRAADAGGVARWGMCTDSLQPISNTLYARRGMVPRLPAWRLYGEIRRPGAVPELAHGLSLRPFVEITDGDPAGHRRLADVVNALDHEIIGLDHAQDHVYLRRDGRIGWLLHDGSGRPLGYGYGSGAGRLGPFAATDPALLAPLVGAVIRELRLDGPVAAWVPGSAGPATTMLLDAGLRLDGFPALVCWSDAPHPFERYLPISLALV